MLRQEALEGDSVQLLHVTFERLSRKHFKHSGRKKRHLLVQALMKGPASSCNPGGGKVTQAGKAEKVTLKKISATLDMGRSKPQQVASLAFMRGILSLQSVRPWLWEGQVPHTSFSMQTHVGWLPQG